MTGLSPARDRILIVDDEQSIQYVISELIAHMGHEAVVAGNGKEAMKTFGRGAFDLVITDLDMPEANGLALAAFIKERSPHTPVVLITGSGLEAVEEGAVDVVVRKPFTRAELENTVQTLLHREDRQWVRTHPRVGQRIDPFETRPRNLNGHGTRETQRSTDHGVQFQDSHSPKQ